MHESELSAEQRAGLEILKKRWPGGSWSIKGEDLVMSDPSDAEFSRLPLARLVTIRMTPKEVAEEEAWLAETKARAEAEARTGRRTGIIRELDALSLRVSMWTRATLNQEITPGADGLITEYEKLGRQVRKFLRDEERREKPPEEPAEDPKIAMGP